MSTLVIEGGHRIEGRVDVEGNKNAALPLLAACLLTDEWCTLENMPRIADVEVMARLLLDLGAEVEGIGAGRAASRLGPAAGAVAGPPRTCRRRAAGRGLPGSTIDQDTPRGASRDGGSGDSGLGPPARGLERPETGVDLPG